MQEILETTQIWITSYGIKILGSLLLIILGRWVVRHIKQVVSKIMSKTKAEETIIAFTSNLVSVSLMTFVLIGALGVVGIPTASLVTLLGAAGLAVGLALQGSLANFAAGVLLILFKPFKIGDFIECGGVHGEVEDINIFTTELKSPDNKKIIVPNAKITGDNIINYTAKDSRRLDLVIGVSYEENLDKVRSVLEKILKEDSRILENPPPLIGVLELADSSINFAVRPWVTPADYWSVYFSLQEKFKKRFDEENITIPFPQKDVHLFMQKKKES